MPRFSYVARDMAGAAQQGQLVATTTADAVRSLRSDGKFVVQLREVREPNGPAAPVRPRERTASAVAAPSSGGRAKADEVVFFAAQLAVMIETGVSISDALTSMIESTPLGRFRRVLEDLRTHVQSGKDFSAAVAAHPKVFSPLFANMVRAAEATGTLGAMLRRMADYLRRQRETRRRIRGAMAYPTLVLIAAIGVVILLMTYVLPKFTAIYAGREALLPAPTRILIAVSTWMVHYWPIWSGGLLLVAGVLVLVPRTRWGRPPTHWLLLRMPILGPMLRKAVLTRCLRTLGTLVGSGVSILESVAMTRRVAGNALYERVWGDVEAALQRGEQLSDPLMASPLMPRYVVQMVRAGEKAGQLGPVLQSISDFLETDLAQSISTATKLVEPVLMVVMGAIVGGIAIALLLPIFTISRVIAH